MISILKLIYNWLGSLTKSDWILFFTLIAIVVYTIETYKLRKWQQKSVQISILDLRQRILIHGDEMRSKNASSDLNLDNVSVINMMNNILKYGEFDFNKLYSKGIIKERHGLVNHYVNILKSWYKK